MPIKGTIRHLPHAIKPPAGSARPARGASAGGRPPRSVGCAFLRIPQPEFQLRRRCPVVMPTDSLFHKPAFSIENLTLVRPPIKRQLCYLLVTNRQQPAGRQATSAYQDLPGPTKTYRTPTEVGGERIGYHRLLSVTIGYRSVTIAYHRLPAGYRNLTELHPYIHSRPGISTPGRHYS